MKGFADSLEGMRLLLLDLGVQPDNAKFNRLWKFVDEICPEYHETTRAAIGERNATAERDRIQAHLDRLRDGLEKLATVHPPGKCKQQLERLFDQSEQATQVPR